MSEDEEGGVSAEIETMKAHLGVNLDRELAAKLSIDPSAIAAWRRRKSVPEKYRIAYRRASDERAVGGLPFKAPSAGRLREGYVFSLLEQIAKTPIPDDFGLLPVDWFLIWRGIRLANAYSYVQDQMPNTADKDELRRSYENIRAEIASPDFLQWLESLS